MPGNAGNDRGMQCASAERLKSVSNFWMAWRARSGEGWEQEWCMRAIFGSARRSLGEPSLPTRGRCPVPAPCA